MNAHGAKKRFGQHFLHDPAVIRRIVDALDPKSDETIVEIGPGRGAISAPIVERVGKLTVVEIDRDVIDALRTRCNDAPGLQVKMADALKFDFSALARPGTKLRLVGNLPYNISSPLLFHLLSQAHAIEDMLFMLQKEVVDRMVAIAGDKDYGRLSVSLAARAQVDHLFNVGPGAFQPPPKVDSAVVRLVPRTAHFEVRNWKQFDHVVTAAFSQRRKQLGNSLKSIVGADQLRDLGIDPSLRAENLSPEQFAFIANLAEAHVQDAVRALPK